jgi:hypothetical protein
VSASGTRNRRPASYGVRLQGAALGLFVKLAKKANERTRRIGGIVILSAQILDDQRQAFSRDFETYRAGLQKRARVGCDLSATWATVGLRGAVRGSRHLREYFR